MNKINKKNNRINRHPILEISHNETAKFSWNKTMLTGHAGEMISSALIANGIHIFGHHPKDNSPQGIFCANGQCSQCLVIVDGKPVKSCMTALKKGMKVESVAGIPELPARDSALPGAVIPITDIDVLIIGGGPAGLTAAIELGKLGIATFLIDDKDCLGGKLVLQTHKFFGSVEDSYAGTRGFEIGKRLSGELEKLHSVTTWLNTTAVGVFSDGIVGLVKNNRYHRIRPNKLLVATGAREKMLSFPGNTLPGIYGAGAFQTLVNRDLVRPAKRILIVGGGNVGLIAGYHALQAGIDVVAVIEALPEVGGYKVHADKLIRLGVPIFTRHTVISAEGKQCVESVTIGRLDDKWRVIPGTAKQYAVDTVLVAVGLSEVNEFYLKAKQWGMDVFSAGDAHEIAEASAAMFTGKIIGLKIARSLGLNVGEIPAEWDQKATVLKTKPGKPVIRNLPPETEGVLPIFHCFQEIPCNPCISVCPINAVRTEKDKITGLPYKEHSPECTGCLNCAAICPGLAITVVDYRKDASRPTVAIPYEIRRSRVAAGQIVAVTDKDGVLLGNYPVKRIRIKKNYPKTLLVQVRMDNNLAKRAAGIKIVESETEPSSVYEHHPLPDEAIICRCERISAGEIRSAVKNGVRDLNHVKAITRAGMGACGSKNCRPMIWRIFTEEGVNLKEITDRVDRPLFIEVPLGCFAGIKELETNENI